MLSRNTKRKTADKTRVSGSWDQTDSPQAFLRLSEMEQVVSPRGGPFRKKKGLGGKILLTLVAAAIFTFYFSNQNNPAEASKEPAQTMEEILLPISEEATIVPNLLESGEETEGVGAKEEVFEPVTEIKPKAKKVKIEHIVSRGETLSSVFTRNGFSQLEASSVDKLLKADRSVDHRIRPGQKILFQKNNLGELSKVKIELGLLKSVVLRKDSGVWDTEVNTLSTETEVVKSSGEIKTTLAEAGLEVGLDYGVIDEFVDLFSDRVRFHRDIQKGDKFSVIFEESRLPTGEIVSKGPIKAAMIETGGSTFEAIQITDRKGNKRFVDRNGEPLGNTFLRYPLKFSRISSTYTHSRLHPVLKRRMPHLGVDFAAPTGTPVRSVADGKVTFAGRKGPNGIMIKINHGARYRTAYLHLSRIAKGVRVGSFVKRGQVIGKVGSTGRSTGPHLDFRFYDRGRSVNPLKVKLPKMSLGESFVVNKAELKKAIYELEGLMALTQTTKKPKISQL